MCEQSLIEFHSEECSKLVHGQCSLRSCLIRGGWQPGPDVNYDKATCRALETVSALSKLAAVTAERDRLRDLLREARGKMRAFPCGPAIAFREIISCIEAALSHGDGNGQS